jgi:predicted DNA-binding transcriptional regulator YafY
MTLKLAVKNSVVLKLKYYPNKDGKARSGWRTVLPLDLYSYRNVLYMLGWQSDGASVSGGSGYRLFFTRNIQEYKEADTTVQQPFAMARINASQHKTELKVKAWHMVKTGQVE